MSESISYPTYVQPVSGEIAPAAAGSYALFNAPAVTLATFFGTPAAGSLLMAVNYRRLGQAGHAALILILGLLVTGLAIGLGFALPNGVTYPIGLALLVGMRLLAVKLQGAAVAQHVSHGGKLGSKWVALGVGIAFLAVIFLVVVIPVYLSTVHSKVKIGEKDEVYYTGSATKLDAQKLGLALKGDGYFQDRGTSVFLDKDSQGPTISLVMQEGMWDKPGMMQSAEMVVRGVADSVGGFPVRVKLIDSSENVKKTGSIGRFAVGADEIYYLDDASQANAAALGTALKTEDYFAGKGATVILSKQAGLTAIAFVVSDGYWADDAHVQSFETLVKTVGPVVGGMPITLRLDNTQLETEKEVAVQ